MPTSAQMTFSNTVVQPVMDPQEALRSMLVVKLKASTTYAAGTVLGEVTATPGTYGAYASGNSDGTQNATAILPRPVTTDSSGNWTDEWGSVLSTTPVYTTGKFRTQDLVGLDTNAVTKLAGRLLEGSVTSGIIAF